MLALSERPIIFAINIDDPEVGVKGVDHFVGPFELVDDAGSVWTNARISDVTPIPESVRAKELGGKTT